MTTDVCGSTDTHSGNPCQNPAGSCPWHDTDDPPDTGRDFVIDKADHEDILEAAREGLSKAGCARAAGATKDSLRRYLEAHPEFRAAFERARRAGESRIVEDGMYGDADPSMAKFLLSTSFGYIKTEKREVDADVETTVDTAEGVTAEFVTYENDE